MTIECIAWFVSEHLSCGFIHRLEKGRRGPGYCGVTNTLLSFILVSDPSSSGAWNVCHYGYVFGRSAQDLILFYRARQRRFKSFTSTSSIPRSQMHVDHIVHGWPFKCKLLSEFEPQFYPVFCKMTFFIKVFITSISGFCFIKTNANGKRQAMIATTVKKKMIKKTLPEHVDKD